MPWKKRGLVFKIADHAPWIRSHAQVPTVLVKEDALRVYYAGRNEAGKSFTTFVDLDRRDPSKIIYVHDRPVISMGEPGTFDDEGVMPSYAHEYGGKIYLYYSGWNQRVTTPYHNAMGVAVSEDGGASFHRVYDGPILDRNRFEPYVAVTPSVMREGSNWHMWYVSGIRWTRVQEKYEPVYVIKYAHSRDGLDWERPNITCIQPKNDLEAFSRPHVIKQGDLYRMWYCYRHSVDYRDGHGSYRIGYAESKDAVHWDRRDSEAGITESESGWDSTMICYPFPVQVDDKLYLFHNGNGFGQSGFGYAEWVEG